MKIHASLLWCILLFFLTQTWGLGQKTDFRIISKSAKLDNGVTLNSGPMWEKANEIYQKLYEARGDKRFPPPPLVVSRGVQNVAYLEGDGQSIGIEEKAYKLLAAKGEDYLEKSLAAILGHELTHFFEKHQWRSGFVESFKDLDVGQRLKDMGFLESVNNEAQADYLGGFLAYSAGYDIFSNMPAFFDLIYKNYNLNDSLMSKRYPSKEDRKALSQRSLEKVDELIDVFEVANLMAVVADRLMLT